MQTTYDIELRFPEGCMTDSTKVRVKANSSDQALKLAIEKTKATSLIGNKAVKAIHAQLV